MQRSILRAVLLLSIFCISFAPPASDETDTWNFKEEFLPFLIKAVPVYLEDQETTSGRFGSDLWIVNDQHAILPLATAWSYKHEKNPYYKDARVLEAVMKGGDALIDDQNKIGKWVFRKKDGSTWGDIYMPWTYSRWIRAFGLIRKGMPPERRERWEKALTLGFTGIAREEFTSGVQNIPAHHAMGLYRAGQLFEREDWRTLAKNFMADVVAEQTIDGYWSENNGPVVGYNTVYVDALGAYYAMSKDKSVLPALERAARFHSNFTYPDGTSVETVDERQVYYTSVTLPSVGFTFSPEGRGYLKRQWEIVKDRPGGVSGEAAAYHLIHGEEGSLAPVPPLGQARTYVTQDGLAGIFAEGDWFSCLSAYHCPVPDRRWIQDRQNLVSLFHNKTGLIVGGGNTKLQPLWSTFTLGDVSLLKHNPGEESPNFVPPPGILHVPGTAKLEPEGIALDLMYGEAHCRVDVNFITSNSAELAYSTDNPTSESCRAHIPFLVKVGSEWRSESGRTGTLSEEPFRLGKTELGSWFEHEGRRIGIPADSQLIWPALPHNPYRKDGRAEINEGRLVLELMFSESVKEHKIEITVVDAPQL